MSPIIEIGRECFIILGGGHRVALDRNVGFGEWIAIVLKVEIPAPETRRKCGGKEPDCLWPMIFSEIAISTGKIPKELEKTIQVS